MTRLVHALLLGLCGAGIVHIVVLFLMPHVSDRDAWSRLEAVAAAYAVVRLDPVDARDGVVGSVDPLFDAVACRFDLGDGVVRLHSRARVPFWSMSIYNRTGYNVFSFNDRTAQDGMLDVVVADPRQMIELRNDMPEEFGRSIFVEAEIGEGIAVVRSFLPDPTWEPTIAAHLQQTRCELH